MNQPAFAAGGLLTAIPIVILFLSLQKQLVSGLAAGSVKG
jgi:arabinogalactan oligomer/maltooligosaccharide transport system permease protein